MAKHISSRLTRGLQGLSEWHEDIRHLIEILAFVAVILHLLPRNVLLLLILLLTGIGMFKFVDHEINRRKRLRLKRRRQALAWTHYRSVLAEAIARSVDRTGKPKFDFVTFFNGEFESCLKGKFYSETQYTRSSHSYPDMLIFDIEHLYDLRRGVEFDGATYQLVDFDRFFDRVTEQKHLLAIPDHFKSAVTASTVDQCYAWPLQWGFNGVGLKLGPRSRQELNRLEPKSAYVFELNWLWDEHSPVYRWLKSQQILVALDWYLPVMALMAWELVGEGYTDLKEQRFNELIEKMDKVSELMCSEEPLVRDPLRLARRVQREGDLIILGGGNWLHLRGERVPDELKLVPVGRGYLLWCECLGFLTPKEGPSDFACWTADANNLIRWLMKRYGTIQDATRFETFSFEDEKAYRGLKQDLKKSGGLLRVRQLPPMTSVDFVSRDRWEGEWNKWKEQLCSRSTVAPQTAA